VPAGFIAGRPEIRAPQFGVFPDRPGPIIRALDAGMVGPLQRSLFARLHRNDLDFRAQRLAEVRLNAQPPQARSMREHRQQQHRCRDEPYERDRFIHPHHPESFLSD